MNAPKVAAQTNQRDGQMALYVDKGGENPHVNYEPSAMGGLREAARPAHEYRPWVEGHLGRYENSRTQDDYKQAGERYRTFDDREREDLIANLVDDMKACPESIQLRMVWHFWHCDPDYGRRVAEGAGIDLARARALPPMEGKPAPGERREATYTDGSAETGAHKNDSGNVSAPKAAE